MAVKSQHKNNLWSAEASAPSSSINPDWRDWWTRTRQRRSGRPRLARPPARQRLIPFVTVSLNNKAPTETLNTDELQQKVPRFRDPGRGSGRGRSASVEAARSARQSTRLRLSLGDSSFLGLCERVTTVKSGELWMKYIYIYIFIKYPNINIAKCW